jgi:ferritin-like metal-binding protein YciE
MRLASVNPLQGDRMAAILSSRELLVDKLGAALTMEETSLGMLALFTERASDSRLRLRLERQHQETRLQIRNLQHAFEALGEDGKARPSLVVDALEKEATRMIEQVDDGLVDSVILDRVIEGASHEIAIYNELIINAETIEEEDLVPLFQENLEQEEQALDEAIKKAEQVSYQLAKQSL